MSAAAFIATSTVGSSPGVVISWSAMFTWNADTPLTVPAGARISAGKSGRVDRSLPNEALTDVNRSPVNCMPSPESPAKRTTRWSRIRSSPDVSGRSIVSVMCCFPPREHGVSSSHPPMVRHVRHRCRATTLHRSHVGGANVTRTVGRGWIGQNRGVLFDELARASEAVAATTKRNEKVAVLADVLRRLQPREIIPAVVVPGRDHTARADRGRLGDVARCPLVAVGRTDTLDRRCGRRTTTHRDDARRRSRCRTSRPARRRARASNGTRAASAARHPRRGTAPGCARRGTDDGRGDGRRCSGRIGSPSRDDGGRPRRSSAGSTHGRSAGTRCRASRAAPSGAADVGQRPAVPSPRRWRRAAGRRSTGSSTGPECRRTGAATRCAVHAQPERRHRSSPAASSKSVRSMPGGDLVLDGEVLGVRDDGSPTSLPGHDGRLRCASGATTHRWVRGVAMVSQAFFFDVLHVDGSPVHRRTAGRPA